tara:strand:+ start:229 stop:789 length:561 start_codon:yes stop_codon:yes gene_type:complete
MPSIDLKFLKKLKEDYRNYQNFIETGTLHGDTIFTMEPYFENLYTIEIKKEFYENTRNKYKGDKINFFLGDSSFVLKTVLEEIKGKSIIFLDGHWSAGETGKGDKDCPLYEELEQIINFTKEEAIIIIDDVRLFGKGPNIGNEKCNWEDINIKNILEITEKRMKENYFMPSCICKNDRLIIHLNKE